MHIGTEHIRFSHELVYIFSRTVLDITSALYDMVRYKKHIIIFSPFKRRSISVGRQVIPAFYIYVIVLVIFIIPDPHFVGTEASHPPVAEIAHVLVRTGKQRPILSQGIRNDATGRLYVQIVVAGSKQQHATHYHQTYCFLHFLSVFGIRNSDSS